MGIDRSGVGGREIGDRRKSGWERGRVGIDRRGEGGEWGQTRGNGVGGGVWIGMSGRGGGERGQTVGWEGERVGIDRGSGVEGERVGIDRGSGWGERGDR